MSLEEFAAEKSEEPVGETPDGSNDEAEDELSDEPAAEDSE
jgi:hypothetical protein